MDNNQLTVKGRYFDRNGKPFFWLGDTAWLIFTNISEEDAFLYLKNRAAKGFTVIQSVLVYATEEMQDVNKMPTRRYDVTTDEYWEHCDRVIRMAGELGMYMALLPSWGSLVKNKYINKDNAEEYAMFLARRYASYDNIIWLLGGDMNAKGYEDVYEIMGKILKELNQDKLVGFHPFGRCASTTWFPDTEWIDINMFQSGHRRYDQCSMGTWDDTKESTSLYGEDNWKFVQRDLTINDKPTLDAEPSYEWILQGLHDETQPYWRAKDARRYAYWSVFAGAAGHTYGDNSIIMFYDGIKDGVTYGAREHWKIALHHEGSGQMNYLKELMESVNYVNGRAADEILVDGQKQKYERVAVFAGEDFVFAYNYTGRNFIMDVRKYSGKDIWLMKPATGIYSYLGKIKDDTYAYREIPVYDENTDVVIVIK